MRTSKPVVALIVTGIALFALNLVAGGAVDPVGFAGLGLVASGLLGFTNVPFGIGTGSEAVR